MKNVCHYFFNTYFFPLLINYICYKLNKKSDNMISLSKNAMLLDIAQIY
jgi:hypothetical protein